jgi:hypothetical protein
MSIPLISDYYTTLKSLWCSSNGNLFAIGSPAIDYGYTRDNRIYYYDGNVWSYMTSGLKQDLNDIWGTSGDNYYAVGESGIILHYDGVKWSSQKSGTTADLYNVWGISANDIFVVGDNIILHYDGSEWKHKTTETVGIVDLWGTSSNNLYGISGNAIQHFDGTSWTIMYADKDPFASIWGSSASDIFAVGYGGTIMHYDGSSWSAMNSNTTTYLAHIWGDSRSNVFVAGYDLILHYDGKEWSTFESVSGLYLHGIWGTSDELFAVGNAILHCAGNRCFNDTISELANSIQLKSVWGNSSTDVFAVGRILTGDSIQETKGMILRYNSNVSPTTTTTTVPSSNCPLSQSISNKDHLGILRALRDNQLNNNRLNLVSLYYTNAAEVSHILADSPMMKERLNDLVSTNMCIAEEILLNGSATVQKNVIDDATDYLIELKKYGSPKLKADIDSVIKGIEGKYLLNGIGISVK